MGTNASSRQIALLDAAILRNARVADATKYDKHWRDFGQFIMDAELEGEAVPLQLRAYAMHLAKRGLKVTTVVQYMSIIKSQGMSLYPEWLKPHELREYYEIARGLKRLFGAEDALEARTKHPISELQLLQLMNTAKSSKALSKLEGLIVASVMCILFGGMMRASDLMDAMAVRPTVDNVVFSASGDSAVLTLPKRKTTTYDQDAERAVHLYAVMPGNPVHHLRLLVNDARAAKRRQLVPAFLHTGLNSFWKILRKLCEEAQIPDKITPHCFRHGGATYLLKRNVNAAVIKRLGGWKSEQAFYRYLHSDPSADFGLLRDAVRANPVDNVAPESGASLQAAALLSATHWQGGRIEGPTPQVFAGGGPPVPGEPPVMVPLMRRKRGRPRRVQPALTAPPSL